MLAAHGPNISVLFYIFFVDDPSKYICLGLYKNI